MGNNIFGEKSFFKINICDSGRFSQKVTLKYYYRYHIIIFFHLKKKEFIEHETFARREQIRLPATVEAQH